MLHGNKEMNREQKRKASYIFRRILQNGIRFVNELTSCKLNFLFKSQTTTFHIQLKTGDKYKKNQNHSRTFKMTLE